MVRGSRRSAPFQKRDALPETSIPVPKNRIFIACPGQSWGPPHWVWEKMVRKIVSSFLVLQKPKKAQKWSGESPKKLSNGLGEARKGSERGSAESPKKLRNGLQKGSEMVWAKPKKAQKLSGRSRGGWGGKVARAIVLGFGSLPLTLKGSTALTASVGLALPWSVQQPQLYLGCTFSALAREARTASGSQVLVASPQQDFRV